MDARHGGGAVVRGQPLMPEAREVASPCKELGVASIASNLNFFRERLLPFVRTAYQAQGDAQLAAAGVYAIAAGRADRALLASVGDQGRAGAGAAAEIQARLPLPEALKAQYAALGVKPKGTTVLPSTASPPPSRADRFDRADFAPRPARLACVRAARRQVALVPPRPPRRAWPRRT